MVREEAVLSFTPRMMVMSSFDSEAAITEAPAVIVTSSFPQPATYDSLGIIESFG